jgi:DNA-binding PadR family transcriptional regulator
MGRGLAWVTLRPANYSHSGYIVNLDTPNVRRVALAPDPGVVLAIMAFVDILEPMAADPAPDDLLPLPPATLHILLALAETDRHGYAIMHDVEARTDGELRLSAGTLYRAVARMVEQGLIVEVEKRRARAEDERRRYYRITSFGLAVARAEVRRLMQLVRHAQARGLSPRII